MDFYDIHDQTKYSITVSKPERPEDLSDLFVTEEELQDMVGSEHYRYHCTGEKPRTIQLNGVITREVMKWAEKLEASGKKTLQIDDEDLLTVLKKGYLTDHTEDTDKYGRHGDRICFARRYKRVKKKATKGDVRAIWTAFQHAFRSKFNCYPSHIPIYDRHLNHFKAWKKIVGWQRVRKHLNSQNMKFYREIWDNPEEFM